MDFIEVNNIKAYGYTGLFEEERILGQWFQVDLTLWIDLETSGKSDNIQDTLDYRQAIEIVKHILKTAKFSLVEKLATVIAEDLLKILPIGKVKVRLSKLSPPIPDFEGSITIEITRCK